MRNLNPNAAPRGGIGDVWRAIKELRKEIAYLRSSRNVVGRATVSGGRSLTIEDGGDLNVNDGGNVLVRGGQVVAAYPSLAASAVFGPFSTVIGAAVHGVGSLTPSGRIIFAATAQDTPSDRGSFQVGSFSDGDKPDVNMFAADVSILGDEVSLSGGGIATNDLCIFKVNGSGASYFPWNATAAFAFKIPTHPTTAAAANCVIDAGTGAISRSTSSRRYKQDITVAAIDVDQVLELEPRTFRSKAEVEAEGADAATHVGFIAEEAADLGLDLWVIADDEGPEAFSYATWVVALQAVARDQRDKIIRLEKKGQEQDARLAALEARAGST